MAKPTPAAAEQTQERKPAASPLDERFSLFSDRVLAAACGDRLTVGPFLRFVEDADTFAHGVEVMARLLRNEVTREDEGIDSPPPMGANSRWALLGLLELAGCNLSTQAGRLAEWADEHGIRKGGA